MSNTSADRLAYEKYIGQPRYLIRQRGRKKLYAQPRHVIVAPVAWGGKWSPGELRAIRARNGVGRPPEVTRMRDYACYGLGETWL